MSTTTHPVNSSPVSGVLQQLFSQLAPVVRQRTSDVSGAASDATASVTPESKLTVFLKRLGESIDRWEIKQEEAYLAQSSDIYDLEHRMRRLEYMRSSNANRWASNNSGCY